jgi:hypothetical protein
LLNSPIKRLTASPMPTYYQINIAERRIIAQLIENGEKPAAIARALGRNRSTIKREIDRNGSVDEKGKIHYNAVQAQSSTQVRKSEATSGSSLRSGSPKAVTSLGLKQLFTSTIKLKRERMRNRKSRFEIRLGVLKHSKSTISYRSRKINFSYNYGKSFSSKTSFSLKKKRGSSRFAFNVGSLRAKRKTTASFFAMKLSKPAKAVPYNKEGFNDKLYTNVAARAGKSKTQNQEHYQHFKKIKLLAQSVNREIRDTRAKIRFVQSVNKKDRIRLKEKSADLQNLKNQKILNSKRSEQREKIRAVSTCCLLPGELREMIHPAGDYLVGVRQNYSLKNLSKKYPFSYRLQQALKIEWQEAKSQLPGRGCRIKK